MSFLPQNTEIAKTSLFKITFLLKNKNMKSLDSQRLFIFQSGPYKIIWISLL